MFKDAKVDSRVWSFVYGWGTITSITCGRSYPLSIRFDNGCSESYTFEGKRIDAETNPSLFWNEIKFEVPSKPKQKCKFWVVFCYDGKGNIFVHGDGIFPTLFKDFNKALEVGTRIRVANITQIEVEI